MFIEPTPITIKALENALKLIGKENFLSKTKITEKELEEFLSGEKWIPLEIITIACKINRQHGEKPSSLSEIMKGAVVLIRPPTYEKEVKDQIDQIEAIKEKGKISIKTREEEILKIVEQRKKLFKTIMIKSTILLSLMIPFIALGYFIGKMYSEIHANLGIVAGILIWLFIVILYTLLTPPEKLGQGIYK